MKTGTPIKEVMIPIGYITPGVIDLEINDVSDKTNAPTKAESGTKNR